jgi:hypothetical protein
MERFSFLQDLGTMLPSSMLTDSILVTGRGSWRLGVSNMSVLTIL